MSKYTYIVKIESRVVVSAYIYKETLMKSDWVRTENIAVKQFDAWFPSTKKTEKNIAKAKTWAQDFIQMLERSEI